MYVDGLCCAWLEHLYRLCSIAVDHRQAKFNRQPTHKKADSPLSLSLPLFLSVSLSIAFWPTAPWRCNKKQANCVRRTTTDRTESGLLTRNMSLRSRSHFHPITNELVAIGRIAFCGMSKTCVYVRVRMHIHTHTRDNRSAVMCACVIRR